MSNFPIYDQFGAIRKPHSGCIVRKTYIFIKGNFLSCKNWKQNWKIPNTAPMLLLWVKVLFLPKILTSAKLREPWCWNVYFLKLRICLYLCTKFQVSSIILTSFRHRRYPVSNFTWMGTPPPSYNFFRTPPIKTNAPMGRTLHLKMKPPPHLKNTPPPEKWSTLPWNEKAQ